MENLADQKRRLAAWTALSALFIDNEVGPAEHEQAAGELARAGFNALEAEQILREQVAPVFVANLWTVAGEWQPWSEDDVARIMASQLPRGWWARFMHRLRVRMARKTADDIWRGLQPFFREAPTSL